ncbi:MAG: signal peptidase [Prevotella sp.]|nr:signal peptidase [Prevotella sp.]
MNTSDTQRRWLLRQALLLVATCAVLVCLMLLIRAYAFTIFADRTTGERVIVNRLNRQPLERGDRVVFEQNGVSFMGLVEAVPGDTITLDNQSYVIPTKCVCQSTECAGCRFFLIKTAQGKMLTNSLHVTGKAYKIY